MPDPGRRRITFPVLKSDGGAFIGGCLLDLWGLLCSDEVLMEKT